MAKNHVFKGSARHPWTTLDSAPCAVWLQGAGSIPVPPARGEPEFVGIAGPVAPADCTCFDLHLTPPWATPQISECGPLGDWLPGRAGGSGRLCL